MRVSYTNGGPLVHKLAVPLGLLVTMSGELVYATGEEMGQGEERGEGEEARWK